MASDPHPNVGKWLDTHHRVEQADDKTPVHVFALEQGGVFEAQLGTKTYEVTFHLGPVTITIIIVVNLLTRSINVCIYAKVPLLPVIKLGCGFGGIDLGVQIKFDESPIASGDFKFYAKGGWLRLKYDAKILGGHYSGDIALIPLKV